MGGCSGEGRYRWEEVQVGGGTGGGGYVGKGQGQIKNCAGEASPSG